MMLAPANGAEVWLIRHGETVDNAIGRLQGQTDTPLSARGRAQALVLATRLASLACETPPRNLPTCNATTTHTTPAVVVNPMHRCRHASSPPYTNTPPGILAASFWLCRMAVSCVPIWHMFCICPCNMPGVCILATRVFRASPSKPVSAQLA